MWIIGMRNLAGLMLTPYWSILFTPYSPLTVLFISPIYYTKRKKNMKKTFILN